ncbi:MAG: NAD-dependent epimerase/dehydratase family protein [Deltaproteobacteria bacterium]|nr:NAD-dependent epimerase/dehydratase family protein [Deltaproteobacteria bacterium]
MKMLVTGAAGFIGSNLCRELLKQENLVIGIDSFEDYYPKYIKEKNISDIINHPRFKLIEKNITDPDLNLYKLLLEIDVIFHLAGQGGVRASWGKEFEVYLRNNIHATQILLELSKRANIKKFIYASSSSVYGDTKDFPLNELKSFTRPVSPYGVSKLAAENLCYLYYKNFNLPTISMRYFTVYGEGQRPDMAFHKFIKNTLEDLPIEIYGNGTQVRDFTYIKDIVEASILMINAPSGKIYNIGGGNKCTLEHAIDIIEQLINKKIIRNYSNFEKGDVFETQADLTLIKSELGFNPKYTIEEGLNNEIKYIKDLYSL